MNLCRGDTMGMANEASGEERLIARYFRPLAKHPATPGLPDEAAVLEPPAGGDLVLKTDGLIGGVSLRQDPHIRASLLQSLSNGSGRQALPLLALPDTQPLERRRQSRVAPAPRRYCWRQMHTIANARITIRRRRTSGLASERQAPGCCCVSAPCWFHSRARWLQPRGDHVMPSR